MKRTITIVGGGLAGLSLGIGLRKRDVPVVLHEAGSYPRHRVCGEFVCGVQKQTLDALGIAEIFDKAIMSKTCAWYDQQTCLYQGDLPIHAYGVSRYTLDQELSDLFVDLGGDLRTKSRLDKTEKEGLVWAAGRKPQKSEWIGLKMHLYHFKPEADLEMHMANNGYVGIAPIEGGKWNVCGLFKIDPSIKASKDTILLEYMKKGGLDILASKLEPFETDPDSFSAVSGFVLGEQVQDSKVLSIGDASTMIPPFTGNGMSMAFESAETALLSLGKYAEGQIEWSDVVSEVNDNLNQLFRTRMRTSMGLHPVLLSSVGQKLTKWVAKTQLLPFQTLFSRLR